MTRINLPAPAELSDQHEFAEIRELPRVRHLRPRHAGGCYRLGAGHVTFFLDKGAWLEKRHAALLADRAARGLECNIPVLKLDWSAEYMQDWEPSADEIALSRARIQERIRNGKIEHRWTPTRKADDDEAPPACECGRCDTKNQQ